MIYIAASNNTHIHEYIKKHGFEFSKVRAVTRPEQLIGLTGGNLYLLPTFKQNSKRKEILASAKDRFIHTINISMSMKKVELEKIEADKP